MLMHSCVPIQEGEARGSQVQGQSWLPSKHKGSLGYTSPSKEGGISLWIVVKAKRLEGHRSDTLREPVAQVGYRSVIVHLCAVAWFLPICLHCLLPSCSGHTVQNCAACELLYLRASALSTSA